MKQGTAGYENWFQISQQLHTSPFKPHWSSTSDGERVCRRMKKRERKESETERETERKKKIEREKRDRERQADRVRGGRARDKKRQRKRERKREKERERESFMGKLRQQALKVKYSNHHTLT